MLKKDNPTLKHSLKALGTEISFDLVVPDSSKKREAADLLQKAERFIQDGELIFSRFNPKSELSHLNSRLGQWTEASELMIELTREILHYAAKSNGRFDPRIIGIIEAIGYHSSFEKINLCNNTESSKQSLENKMFRGPIEKDLLVDRNLIMFRQRMDFSGLAKGYLADKVSQLFKKSNFSNFIVDLGGDMYVSGQKNNQENWYIGVEGIEEENILLKLSNCAVATSGINRKNWQKKGKKYHHLINPKQPENFDFNISSVSVLADTVVEADYRAKIIFLRGQEGPGYCEENNIAAIFVYSNGHYSFSSSIENFLI